MVINETTRAEDGKLRREIEKTALAKFKQINEPLFGSSTLSDAARTWQPRR
jgi:hypothetical protein